MKYATNLIYEGDTPFIRDRTHHKIRERDGRAVTAECGASFHAEHHQLTDDESDLRDRKKCLRCFRA